jgi:hypothetical protein
LIHYVYVIGEEGGPYKVGFSANPIERMKALRYVDKPQRLQVWHLAETSDEPRARAVERLAHQYLAEHQMPNRMGTQAGADLVEWFNAPLQKVIDTVERARDDAARGVEREKVNRYPFEFLLRLSPSLCERIDDWRREQADIPSRNEAIRRLLEQALGTA